MAGGVTPSTKAQLAAAAISVLLGGCASQAYDPVPPADAATRRLVFDSPLGVEGGYRRLHAGLAACAGTGYHVHPRYEHAPERAWVMVVSGIGLDRYSFLGNRFEARFDLEPAPGGARVTATWVGEPLAPLVRAARRWLVAGARGCSA